MDIGYPVFTYNYKCLIWKISICDANGCFISTSGTHIKAHLKSGKSHPCLIGISSAEIISLDPDLIIV